VCFSAEADLFTGVVVGVVGIDALRRVRKPHQLALAATPVLFAVHEVDEAFVWWGLHGQVSWPAEHAAIDGSHIAYTADISYADILVGLYIVATCGACLVASNRWLVLLGLANLSAVIALGWITFTGFTSLWCAWAALTSIAIAIYLRRSGRSVETSVVAFEG
jgi:hypothetical protein